MEAIKKQKISVIVPCKDEAEALPLFFIEIDKVKAQMPDYCFELIFIDDGSEDNTLAIMRERANADPDTRYISFSRSFGKESGMLAGMTKSTGDLVVIMDADLQDPPSLLPQMVALMKEKCCDSIGTMRSNRKGEPPIRSFFAKCFYKIINKISKVHLVPGARDYRLMSRRMVNSVLQLTEYNRFSKGIFNWVGYKTEWIGYPNIERKAGKTKWSFWKLFKYSLECIIAFSTAPLAISSLVGFLLCILSILGIIFVIIRAAVGISSAYGWPSLVCILLFVSGIQLFAVGILGQYVSKTYLETKKRPHYFIAETEKDNKKES